jgi:septum formation inhibitor-activating ATPase MinD
MIVAVCGLHGGAGTTTIATLLARAAAAQQPGRVLLCDSAPGAGDLALALGATSPYNLTDVARLAASRQTPAEVPWLDQADGLRVMARAPARRAAAQTDAVTQVLRDAGAVHSLVVVDAGTLRAEHATAALRAADVVLWTLDATARLDRCATLIGGPLATEARHARWLLAASATGRDSDVPVAARLTELVPTAARLVLIPALGQRAAVAPQRLLAGTQLLSALR